MTPCEVMNSKKYLYMDNCKIEIATVEFRQYNAIKYVWIAVIELELFELKFQPSLAHIFFIRGNP